MPVDLVTNRFERLLATICGESGLPRAVTKAEQFIDERLRTKLNIKRSILIGSFASRTAVPGYSDVDYLIEMGGVAEEQQPDSILVLLNTVVSGVLDGGRAEIRCPAVVFTIGQNNVDLVPACECTSSDEFPAYLIPDCWKGWQRSSPETHIAAIDQRDRDFGGDLRRLIRLAKIWKYRWSIPISSYQMERVVLDHSTRLCQLRYDQALHEVLAVLLDSDPASILDRPRQLSTSANQDHRVRDIQATLASCVQISKAALIASAAGDDLHSIAAWNEVLRGALE